MGFELNNLQRPPVDAEFKPHDGIADGEGLQLKLNLDLLTMARLEEMEGEFEKATSGFKQETPESADKTAESATEKISVFHFEKANIRFKARMLGGKPGEDNPQTRHIREWSLVEYDNPVPVSYEALVKLPATILNKLYDFVTGDAAMPKKTS